MILISKILHVILGDVQWQNFFQVDGSSRLREHLLKLRKVRSRLDLRKLTFSQSIVNMWNDLPADVVTASSVKAIEGKRLPV